MPHILQRLVALLGLLALSPVALAAAVATWFDGGRPVVYVGERIGRSARPFHQFKLRTMVHNADDLIVGGPLGEVTRPRITRVGRLLRKTSIDEVPQLWNVVRGDMALVGPRPVLPVVADRIGHDHRRFDALPGITGLAQVSGRNRLLWSKRLELDAQYVDTRSIALDISILIATVQEVFTGSNVVEDRNTAEVFDI